MRSNTASRQRVHLKAASEPRLVKAADARRQGFVEPMLAKLVRELPEGPRWQYEVKWDGYRVQAVKDGDEVKLFSRRANDFTKRFRPVAEAVAGIRAERAMLDG